MTAVILGLLGRFIPGLLTLPQNSQIRLVKYIFGGFAIAFILGSLYYTGYSNGKQSVEDRVNAANVEWQAKLDKLQHQYDIDVAKIQSDHHIEVEKFKQQISNIKANPKIITKYVTDTDTVPYGFVLLHDRCVKGVPLNTMIDELGVKKSYKLTDVSNVIAYNYSQCNIAFARLNALQTVVKNYIEKQEKLK